MTPEGKLKKDVRKYLDSFGSSIWYFMPVPTGFGLRGIPDFVGCCCGRFFAVETKAPGGKVTAFQNLIHNRITLAGGLVIVAYSMEDITHAIQSKS